MENGTPIVETTVQHVTRDEMNDPEMKEMISAFNEKLTNRLDDKNFDNPELVDFHLTDDSKINLLDERIHARSSWDSWGRKQHPKG